MESLALFSAHVSKLAAPHSRHRGTDTGLIEDPFCILVVVGLKNYRKRVLRVPVGCGFNYPISLESPDYGPWKV
jgi:hypothetical protein